MEIAFNTLTIRSLCEDEAEAEKYFGKDLSQALKRRLADIRAATSISDLVVGTPSPLSNGDRDKMCIELSPWTHLVFCANHRKNPCTDGGEIDWKKVTRIKIMAIGENHD